MKKKFTVSLLTLSLICGSSFFLAACKGDHKKTTNTTSEALSEKKLGKDDLIIKGEEDDTDIYAIPYDDSEPEENLEMQYLEKEGREAALRDKERKNK